MTGPGELAADLVAWGRVVLLETTGRRSGLPREAAVGFVDEPDGSILVAASGESTDWARNLVASPRCRVTRDGVTRPHTAERLREEDRQRAVVALVLRYGTPAERLGHGPAFRLRPDPAEPVEDA